MEKKIKTSMGRRVICAGGEASTAFGLLVKNHGHDYVLALEQCSDAVQEALLEIMMSNPAVTRFAKLVVRYKSEDDCTGYSVMPLSTPIRMSPSAKASTTASSAYPQTSFFRNINHINVRSTHLDLI